jgi:hypothetical protein
MRRLLQAASSAMALGFGALFALWIAGPALGSGPVAPLALDAIPRPLNNADPAANRVGRLLFLGAVELRADDARFGGLSGMLWEGACGRLLAVSDTGLWAILEPREEGGRLVGISRAWMAPVRTPSGNPPLSKRAADAESLARTSDGATWVFYEQDHRAERFTRLSACQPDSLASVPDRRWQPDEMRDWPSNGGGEASAAVGDRLMVLAEQLPGVDSGRLGIAAVPGGAVTRFTWPASEGFQPTAMEPATPGDSRMLVLERRFSPLSGVAAVLAEGNFDGERPAPQAERLALLAPPLLVDNMEALAVRVEGERRFVYLLSDDNFNPLQRTILMKFELLPPPER